MCDREPAGGVSYHLIGDSGLRLVHCRQAGSPVECLGVAADCGSRDERAGQEGLAHFVEHTIFKGTGRRRAWHILNRMESVGGELNAYTTKEHTVVYTMAPAGNVGRSLDLVGDLVCDSRFPVAEIDRERDVVADEIKSYLDQPSEAVFDDFEELIFKGSSLAHNILGTVESIEGFDTDVCRGWLDERFRGEHMVVFYAGSAEPERVVKLAERAFSGLGAKTAGQCGGRVCPPPVGRFEVERDLGLHQAHTVMGVRTGGADADDRYAMALLTNILGGPGMNSLLNVALRERRGLVYSIEASTSLMSDCGLMTIYFGADHEDTERCKRLVRQTIARLADGPMSATALERAKRQYSGQLIVAGDSREQLALSLGRATLMHGVATPREVIMERIRSVGADEIMECARQISELSTLTLK